MSAPKGQDWASYQSTEPSTADLDLVIVKTTEGTGYLNPKHAAQIATGRAHGLVVGHYHFVRPGSMIGQLTYFLTHAAARPGDVLALDWEDAGVSSADKDTFLKAALAAAPHNRVILYCNRDFWFHHDTSSFAGDGLWIADPEAAAGHPRVQHPWVIHQYGETAGIDLDVANFADAAALRAWAAKGTPPPAPKPKPPAYEPFPGAAWFTVGRRSPIVAAMHQRLVAVGCSRYRSNTNKDVIGSGDIASYEAWQRKCGFTGTAAKWPPGKDTWDRLQVPNV